MSRSTRLLGVLAATATALSLAPHALAATAAPAGSDTRAVTYQGYTFTVPGSWDVVDLTATPAACVRFDRHTLYLGTPGADQNCPSDLIGKTEALLVEPAANASAEQGTEQDPIAHETHVAADTVTVTGTYDDDPGLIAAILEGAGLPDRPRLAEPAAGSTAAATASVTATALPSSVTNHRGKGFDTCAAPSAGAMNTWKDSSPYDAVGIYIGGSMRACSQPNLTPSWVKDRAEDGWKFIPLYLGVQAEDITAPTAQGAAAADDAVRNAADLGFGPGSLIYYDMEAYPSADRPDALGFLSSWTQRLHALGYKSAVYSSSSSGINDLARAGSGYTLPDVVFDALWDGDANTKDPVLPDHLWADHQRIKQYAGNVTETWGGTTIKIDRDYLDVNLGPGAPAERASSLNGDGAADLAVLDTAGDLAVRNNHDNGAYFDSGKVLSQGWANFTGQPGKGRLYFADVDGDGLSDLIVHGTDGDVSVRRNLGAGKGFDGGRMVSKGWVNFLGGPGKGRLYFADANGDGRADLIVHDTAGD
ncbi:glycoside hydrolase domain-containing protein, partial [Streptomyces sp. NPDC056528]|uniref:glycoside hydrolase domain-containing protein n=1 Tax=Streptomyces sp. NPDC056528 TaxID=3345854 RepID=UPI0036A56346